MAIDKNQTKQQGVLEIPSQYAKKEKPFNLKTNFGCVHGNMSGKSLVRSINTQEPFYPT